MALVKYGGGIIQMSGSIAGNTFARNRYGNYVRARTVPVNPNSVGQQQVRAALGELTARWSQTLTNVQRVAWNLYGSSVEMLNRLGETVHLTGFNHYIRSNLALNRSGYPVVDDGPTIFELPAADPLLSATGSEATQQITTVYDDTMDWDTEDNGHLWIYMGTPQNPQRNFFDGPWRLMSLVSGALGVPTASPNVGAVPFAMAEGQRVWIYARIQRADGRLSEKFRANFFCAA